jgi:glutathione S-transferase
VRPGQHLSTLLTRETSAATIKFFTDETKRVFGVLNTRLEGREYLVGSELGKYTIADMNAYPWVSGAAYVGIPSFDEWPNLKVRGHKFGFRIFSELRFVFIGLGRTCRRTCCCSSGNERAAE